MRCRGRRPLRTGWLHSPGSAYHADEYGFDGSKIVVVGFCAGGHLAASLGGADERPDVLVLGDPVTLGDWGEPTGKEIPDATALVSADYPPTFPFSTSDDETVPIVHSLALLTALAEHGVWFESHIDWTGVHGISLAKAHTAKGRADYLDDHIAGWLPDSVRFVKAVLGDFTRDVP